MPHICVGMAPYLQGHLLLEYLELVPEGLCLKRGVHGPLQPSLPFIRVVAYTMIYRMVLGTQGASKRVNQDRTAASVLLGCRTPSKCRCSVQFDEA